MSRKPSRRRMAALVTVIVATGVAAITGAALTQLDTSEARDIAAAPTTTRPPTTVATTTTTAPPTTTTTTRPATTTTTAPPEPPLRHPAAEAPLTIWTLGDSTSQTIGQAIEILVRDDPLISARTNWRISSGLSRPDFFDWQTFISLFVTAHKPDAVVISVGANDAQGVVAPDGSVHAFGSPGWADEYRRRTAVAMKTFTDAGIRVYWVGQPLANDVEYTRWMSAINDRYREAATANPMVDYLHASKWLVDGNGHFAPILDGLEVRQRDGIHLTYDGGLRVAREVLAEIRRDIGPAGAPRPVPPPPPPPPAPAPAPAPAPPAPPPPPPAPTSTTKATVASSSTVRPSTTSD